MLILFNLIIFFGKADTSDGQGFAYLSWSAVLFFGRNVIYTVWLHRHVIPHQFAEGQNIYCRKFIEKHHVTTQYFWTFDGPFCRVSTALQSRDTFNRYHYAESVQYLNPNVIMNPVFLVQVRFRCGFKTLNMNIFRSAMIVLHVNKRAMYCG